MHGILLDGHPRASHHDHMLVLRVRPTAGEATARLRRGERGLAADAPGLHALHAHDVARRVRRAVPFGERAGREAAGTRGPRLMRAVAAAAAEHAAGRPHAGTVFIEMDSGETAAEALRRLRQDPHVHFAEPVPARHLLAVRRTQAADVIPPLRLWNLDAIDLDGLSPLGDLSDRVRRTRVAVLDTGVDVDHPALDGRLSDYVHGWSDHGRGLVRPPDLIGHGTHVTGVIAAARHAPMNLRGICAARPTVFKIFRDHAPYDDDVHAFVYTVDPVLYRRALAACAERGMQVVNLSVGGVAPPDPHEQELYDRLLQQGTVLVASAGNSGEQGSPRMYPAAVDGVIAVGATDDRDRIMAFSNRGKYVALSAPGHAIWSSLPMYDGQFFFSCARQDPPKRGAPVRRNVGADAWLGTSAAAPHVTAAVALLLAKRRDLTPAQVRQRLMRSADRVPGMRGHRYTRAYGAGRLNVRRLLGR